MQVTAIGEILMTFTVGCSYLFGISGSLGMMVFASKFPLSTRIADLRLCPERFLGLNGYQVWMLSWAFILAGMLIQLIAFLTRE